MMADRLWIKRTFLAWGFAALPAQLLAMDLFTNRNISLCIGLFRSAQTLNRSLESSDETYLSAKELFTEFRLSALALDPTDVARAKPLVLLSSTNSKALIKLAKRIKWVEDLQGYQPQNELNRTTAVAPDEDHIETFLANAFEVRDLVARLSKGPLGMIEHSDLVRLSLSLIGQATILGSVGVFASSLSGADVVTLLGAVAVVALAGIGTQSDFAFWVWASQNKGLDKLAHLYSEFKRSQLPWAYWSQDILLTEPVAAQLMMPGGPNLQDIFAMNQAETRSLLDVLLKGASGGPPRTSLASIDILFLRRPQPTMVLSFYTKPRPRIRLPSMDALKPRFHFGSAVGQR